MHFHKSILFCALVLSMAASNPMAASCKTAPDTITLNAQGKLFQPFSFNHAKHILAIKECADCHHHTTGTLVLDPNCVRCHVNSSATAVVACRGCHTETPFSPASLADKKANPKRYHLDMMGLKGTLHQSCIGCHTKQAKGPVGCQDCHKCTKAGDAFYSTEVVPKPQAQAKEH